MIDLNKLEDEREDATADKADLFDFYHNNWDALVAEVKRLNAEVKQLRINLRYAKLGDDYEYRDD